MPVPAVSTALNETALLDSINLPGRKAELRQLLKALTLCRNGQGKAVLVTGNEGIGKTAVLNVLGELAQTTYNAMVLRITCRLGMTAAEMGMEIVDAILEQARQITDDTLAQANIILEPVDMHWTREDLIHLVAMRHLQDSVGSANATVPAQTQLAQMIGGSVPFFKRVGGSVNQTVDGLATLLASPWVSLAVSLLNPLNPQVQTAQACRELPGEAVSELKIVLSDLLMFINSALRQQQAACVLILDAWEALDTADLKQCQTLLSETLRTTVEQRDVRLMMVLACRSEAESYALGGPLYNALKQKVLIPSLPEPVRMKWLKAQLEAAHVDWHAAVCEAVCVLSQGNPVWLGLLVGHINETMRQLGLATLDMATYEERFALRAPQDVLDVLYGQLQLAFMGSEPVFLRALYLLLNRFNTQPFTAAQAASLMLQEAEQAVMRQLVDKLVVHHLATAAPVGTIQLHAAFIVPFLRQKTRPVQPELQAPDKIASIRNVLPVSIQSGELTREKTQDLLMMAAAMEDAGLTDYIRQTLLDSLAMPMLDNAAKLALIDSLALFPGETLCTALLPLFSHPDAGLRKAALDALPPLANQSGFTTIWGPWLETILPLTEDIVLSVRQSAYQVAAMWPRFNEATLDTLLKGAQSMDPATLAVCLAGLVRQAPQHPEVLNLYRQFLTHTGEMEPALVALVLKGLERVEAAQAIPILTVALRQRGLDKTGMEMLLCLLNISLASAMPWVRPLLQQPEVSVDIKRHTLKRLGAHPHAAAERLLIAYLTEFGTLAPELRWMALRSLGWIGQTEAALKTLDTQRPFCLHDDILLQALKSAQRQVRERLSPFVARSENEEEEPLPAPHYIDLAPTLAS